MEWSWFPVKLSFFVAATATLITFLLGLAAAYRMSVKKVRGQVLMETLFFLPLVLPPTVIGFLLIIVFGNHSFIGQMITYLTGGSVLFTATGAVMAAAVVSFPLMYQSLKTGFLSVDSHILDAAKVDGATGWRLLVFIMMPQAFRSIVTGIILSFARAFGEFGATLMIAGNIPDKTQTIPIAIYFAIESGQPTTAWLYVLISISFSFVLLLFINQTRKQ